MTLIEECKCNGSCQFGVTSLLERMGITDADIDEIFTGERKTDAEEVIKALPEYQERADAYFITHVILRKLDGLSKSQLLDLLLCVELEADFRRCLPFADHVEGLFTELDEFGCFQVHHKVKAALRGIIATKLCFK